MKSSEISSRLILEIYKRLNFSQKRLYLLYLKRFNVSKKVVSKLSFQGRFTVPLGKDKTFQMIHYGGNIENETFWNGLFVTWENDNGWIWTQLCKISEVIFDVGANTGIYSLVAKTINPNAHVYAFEPSLQTYSKLVTNIELNKFKIKSEQIAISNFTGEQVFYDLPDPHQITASLSSKKMKDWEGYRGKIIERKIKTVTISDYIEGQSIPQLNLLKIDIELHEPEALEGLGIYLLKYKPIMILEILSEDVALRLNNLFKDHEFRIFHLKKGGKAEFLKSFCLMKGSLSSGEWNYLCFHKDLEEKIKNTTNLYQNLI